LFEKNCRIKFLEKQAIKDKAEIDAKDKMIDAEVKNSDELRTKLKQLKE